MNETNTTDCCQDGDIHEDEEVTEISLKSVRRLSQLADLLNCQKIGKHSDKNPCDKTMTVNETAEEKQESDKD